MKLLPFTFERSAKLVQLEYEERYALECAQTAYDEEREKVEIEWKKGHDRVRERLMESIEERRRRAREDKEGEGAVAGKTVKKRVLELLTPSRWYPRLSVPSPYNSEIAE